jgi:hypothetical protein
VQLTGVPWILDDGSDPSQEEEGFPRLFIVNAITKI